MEKMNELNLHRIGSAFVLALLLACACGAQQPVRPGSVKGKVRVEEGAKAGEINITVQQGEREVTRATTDANGRFEINNLAPGHYALVFRKQGLRTAELKDVEIGAGRTRSLSDRVYMPLDESALALLKGSVFNAAGRSVEGARIELARVLSDGSAEKIDGRVTNETGEFSFRLTTAAARYRVTARLSGLPPVSKEIDVEGPAIYRVALSLPQPAH
jgi:5-hydroxyisourate hydrolase-like protein (transthyretin family)